MLGFSLKNGREARSRPAAATGPDTARACPRSSASPVKMVMFHGGKGGVGTTTLASEAAAILAGSDRNVAAVDLDVCRGDLHYRLDVPVTRDTHTVSDLLPVIDDLDTRILGNALSTCPCGARILPAPTTHAAAAAIGPDHVRKVLVAMAAEFEHIIIDSSVAGDRMISPAFDLAELVVLVVTPEIACLGGARRALGQFVSQGGKRPDIALVVNRSLGTSDAVSPAEIESFLQMPATVVLPEDTARCRRLADEGRHVTSERSALGHGIYSLMRHLFTLR